MKTSILLRLPHLSRSSCFLFVVALLLAGIAAPAAAALPAVGADYRFIGDLKSTVHGVPDLQELGSATNTFHLDLVFGSETPVLSFPKANGLLLSPMSSVMNQSVYTIETVFRLNQSTAYRRVMDFEADGTDCGIYLFFGTPRFYCSTGIGSAVIPASTWVRMVVTRNLEGTVRLYIDGDLQFSFDDSVSLYGTFHADRLRFFRDNECTNVGGCTEDSDGSVARIRIWAGLDIGFGEIVSMETCGDANANGVISASDALGALKASVGSGWCSKTRCDVNLSNSVSASDALLILKASVGSATLPAQCYLT